MNLNNNLLQAFLILESQGGDNFLVGGCVRDYLLGFQPKDFDIVTNVPMERIVAVFSQNGWKVDTTGQVFLVVNVSKNGEHFEIANFRVDAPSEDGRRPGFVSVGSMNSDALRRDFTVNAIYYNPMSGNYHDPLTEVSHQSAMKDLRSNTLRFIGRPKDRIEEDYLRVFRFYRFLTKGFTPDKKSLKACREFFNEAYVKTTPERVRVEIERMVL